MPTIEFHQLYESIIFKDICILKKFVSIEFYSIVYKKMNPVMRNSALVVFIFAVCACLIQGAPNSTNETSLKYIRSDLRYASEIADTAETKINSTLNNYCAKVPRVMADDCDEFVTVLKNRTGVALPHLVIKDGLNFTDVETLTGALTNITETVREYVFLVKRLLEKEYQAVCASEIKLGEKCDIPDFCSTQPESNRTSLYCALFKVHDYLDILRINLQRMLPDSLPPLTIDEGKSRFSKLYNLSDLFERWLTMLVLNTLLKQVVVIQQTLAEIPNYL